MTRSSLGRDGPSYLFSKNAKTGNRVSKQCRLRVSGEVNFVIGIFKGKTGKIIAKCIAGLLVELSYGFKGVEKIAPHPGTAIPGQEKQAVQIEEDQSWRIRL